ncbi:hypothetical protein [Pseudomonas sp. CCC3.1]|uniref:hypothetical protein n=1 Tax=Pseudomonas sp. CCC3.1 TaxID=3048607 RepID=UPI002AC93AFC|nr:hypothetical protein [Pseudomonas sp. CCC3.1]MEB0207454.1 hypothetical protein [Pseudomonas sp. CCC3.1]WPX36148.1 hypothetical protein RHM56_23295 [Pseudomonas sp. CCC3.1]
MAVNERSAVMARGYPGIFGGLISGGLGRDKKHEKKIGTDGYEAKIALASSL